MTAKKTKSSNQEYVVIHTSSEASCSYPLGAIAEWESTFFAPKFNSKTEQSCLDTRNAILKIPRFQYHVLTLRHYILKNPDCKLYDLVEEACKGWRIQGGENWLYQLVLYSDFPKAKNPVFNYNKNARPRDFYPCVIELQMLTPLPSERKSPRKPHQSIVTLHAGVSLREAQRATKFAVDMLRRGQPTKKGRPGLNDVDRQFLREEFAKIDLSKNHVQRTIIRRVAKAMKDRNRPLGEGKIGNEYRLYLEQHGYSVKRYVANKHDSPR